MMLPPSEFWNMTPREYFNACDGYNNAETEKMHRGWDQARWVATVMVNINAPKGKRYVPKDIATFPWESDAEDQGDEISKLKQIQAERLKGK